MPPRALPLSPAKQHPSQAPAMALPYAAPAFPVMTPHVAMGSRMLLIFAVLLAVNQLGRPFELVLVGLHIPGVICALAVLAIVLSWGVFVGLKARIGIAVVALVFWMALTIPFSSWKGGSFGYVRLYIYYLVTFYCVLAAAPRTFSDIRKLFATTALACVLHIFIGSRLTGLTKSGRLGLEGTFGNADDVALMAGFVLPLWAFFSLQIRNVFLRVLMLLIGGAYLVRSIGLTGTRAAILGLSGMAMVHFFRTTPIRRIYVMVGIIIASVVLAFTLPAHIRERLATIADSFDSDTVKEQARSNEAMASAAERRQLIQDALKMTATHPFLGVGAGQFPHYRYTRMTDQWGRRKTWFPSHNTYLQISSENGIIGLLLYLVFLGATFRTIRIGYKLNAPGSHPDWESGRQMMVCLELSLVYFVICAVFMTCDRHPHQFLIAGLAVAVERMTRFALSRQSAASAVQPAPLNPLPVVPRAGRLHPAPAGPGVSITNGAGVLRP